VKEMTGEDFLTKMMGVPHLENKSCLFGLQEAEQLLRIRSVLKNWSVMMQFFQMASFDRHEIGYRRLEILYGRYLYYDDIDKSTIRLKALFIVSTDFLYIVLIKTKYAQGT
jgi:hypothetical protein